MGEILDFAEALWKGETTTYAHHPLSEPYGMEKVARDTWFHKLFSNTIIRETPEGLILIDPSGFAGVKMKFESVRSVTSQPLHTAIYTHGHVDHCFGVSAYVEEAQSKGWPRPQVIAHEATPARFRRYRETIGYNQAINSRQFMGGQTRVNFPADFYYPDITYQNRLRIQVGGVTALLRHGRGETDDHTWVFFPDTGVLCPGDLFFWCLPNAGNPQKVQRYCKEWAVALREMASLDPQVLLPGHGWPIIGSDRIKQALEDNARLLEILFEQTLLLMNQGTSLDKILQIVQVPEDLLNKPYLHPVYDEPEFIVRNLWRLYGGWYDGTPSHLKPAPEKEQAEEISRLAGGADKLIGRAKELGQSGNFRLACHLADWAYLAAPDDPQVREAVHRIYTARAGVETSTMSMGIYMARAREVRGEGFEEAVAGSRVLQVQDERGRKQKQ
ncbi:MAG: MBL fold metallo-hydrolase [Deltaproteobacteria bacterium]|nr:MBL fold metallo-hydrolase [Deltaproteobacteria bacterium]